MKATLFTYVLAIYGAFSFIMDMEPYVVALSEALKAVK